MSDSNLLVGTWKLVSWEVTQPGGTIHYLCGRDVDLGRMVIGVGNQKLIRERAVRHG
ncbi:MAG TPA: hypothetical protein PLB02_02510 [Thermoanaerobaculia bacterium]|nr:hypothetical protein [Thermoanaerobaculia bacterium]